MANAITYRTLSGDTGADRFIIQINIVSDGTEEVNTVVFSNASFFANAKVGRLVNLFFSGSDGLCRLSWDQTTDATIIAFNPGSTKGVDLSYWGGIRNPNAAGATGDILLNTANFDTGDEVTIILEVRR